MKFGFLGAGNMSSAIIKGMVKGGLSGKEILAFNPSKEKLKALRSECKILIAENRDEILDCDVIILGVKPQVLDNIIGEIKTRLGERKPLIISLAVGKTIEYLETNLGEDKPLVRVMPNINAKSLMSTTGYCTNSKVSTTQEQIVEEVFAAIGTITKIPENMFSIFSAIAGSSPAFAYLYIDAVAHAAVKAGMPKKQALEIAASTVMGSAKMILQSSGHPWQLIDEVCSPGGTTIEGLYSLQKSSFEASITKAIDAVIEKDMKIQEKAKKKI